MTLSVSKKKVDSRHLHDLLTVYELSLTNALSTTVTRERFTNMPISISHHKAIRAQVRAIPSDDSTHETESEEIGTVSSELWNTLVSSSKRGFKTFSRDDHLLAVALDFNLSGTPATSSHKRLIIWVKASSVSRASTKNVRS